MTEAIIITLRDSNVRYLTSKITFDQEHQPNAVTIRHSLSSCHYLRWQLTLNKHISQENFALFKNLKACKFIIYLQS